MLSRALQVARRSAKLARGKSHARVAQRVRGRVSTFSSVSMRSSTPALAAAANKPASAVRAQMQMRQSANVRSFSAAAAAVESEKVPSLGDSISEGTIVEWTKSVGDWVNADDVLVILETDKVSVDIRATMSGVLTSVAAEEGDTVEVGHELAQIDTAAEKPEGADEPAAEAPKEEASAPAPAAEKAAPAAQKAAPAASKSSTPAPAAAAPAAAQPGSRNETRVAATRMRLTIANRLKEAQNTAACLTTFNEIDMSGLMNMRSKHKDEFMDRHGVKLGFMSAFVKASTAALQRSPDINAYFDGANKQVVYRDYVDISVAVATPTGLVVPVLRNCETMSFADVEGTIAGLGQKARNNQIAMEDMVGGTFTISNGGVYGSLFGTPIINPPQSAILGMHGIFQRPVAINGQVEIRPMMYVALTYDHRLIDGGGAVTFLKDIKNSIEDPSRLLLDI